MATAIIKHTKQLSGEIYAPPSKSYTHRMLTAALLSRGLSRIDNYLVCEDTKATLEAIKSFGAEVKEKEESVEIFGADYVRTPDKPVNCRESGTTLRLMIPVAALAPGKSIFEMAPSLSRRPIEPLLKSLSELGVKSEYTTGSRHVKIYGGGILGGKTSLRGDISSQFISGLMLACPKAKENVEIIITTPLESRGYVEMTEEVIRKHGVEVEISNDLGKITIPAPQQYKPYNHRVPGDFSSAAYILTAAAITSSKVKIKSLEIETRQGDRVILNILKEAGLNVITGEGYVEVEGHLSHPIKVDAKDTPDLVPACAALACYIEGESKIYNVQRLRYKESDRLAAICNELRKMGAEISTSREKNLIVRGKRRMHGAIIDPHGDHRIAMACAAAALGAEGETRILNAECVAKSYPRFFRDLRTLGADVVGVELDR